jgi:hypothetical protein
MSPEASGSKPLRVQAATVRLREAFVEERFGVDARQRFREQASAALRELLTTKADPRGGWVDFALFVEATVLADRLFGKGDLALAWEIGRFASSHTVGVWKRLVMRHVRPATLLGLVAGVWSHHYEGGRLMSRASGPTGLYLQIIDFPAPHRAHCLSIGGWMQGSLEMGPRRNIQVAELGCRALGGPACDFQLSWED